MKWRVLINIILVTSKNFDLIKGLSEYKHLRICRMEMYSLEFF